MFGDYESRSSRLRADVVWRIYCRPEFFVPYGKPFATGTIAHYDLIRLGCCDQNGGVMVGYRCYVLDAEDHIIQAHDLDCQTDAQAQTAAEDYLSQDPYHSSVEVWKATRRIAKLDRAAAQRLRLARRVPRHSQALGSAA